MDNWEPLDENIQHLIIRYLEGEATEGEIQDLQFWISQSEAHFILFSRLKENWLRAGAVQRYDPDRAWERLEGQLNTPKRRLWSRIATAGAAVLLLGIGSLSLLHFHSDLKKQSVVSEHIEPGSKKAILVLGSNERVELGSIAGDSLLQADAGVKQQGNTLVYDKKQLKDTQEYNRLITPRGGEYAVILADGTKVWLNAESDLRYPVHFSAHERKVYLKGEAYFSVTKQEGVPFVVCADDSQITVLGTEFNVRNYQEEVLATTLVKGAVRVNYAGQTCRLIPGQQAVVQSSGLQVQEVETILYTAWKDGYFIYREKTLENILKELSRWYDFTYHFQTEELSRMTLTAKLRKFDRAEDIFEILRGTGRLSFIIKGKEVTVLTK